MSLSCTLKNGEKGKLYIMYLLPQFLKKASQVIEVEVIAITIFSLL